MDRTTQRILEMDGTKMAPYICDRCGKQCDLEMEAYRFNKGTEIIILCSKCSLELYEKYKELLQDNEEECSCHDCEPKVDYNDLD